MKEGVFLNNEFYDDIELHSSALGDEIKSEDIGINQDEAIWCIVANIIKERPYGPGGIEKKRGTKHFRPGAKVYIVGWYAGMAKRIIVIGQHRKSHKFIKIVIDVRLVENLRVKLIYIPSIISNVPKDFLGRSIAIDKERAESMMKAIPEWQKHF